MSEGRPTDDTIALAALLTGRRYLAADEIRHAVERLGFELPSSQWIVGRLVSMCKESSPRFYRRSFCGITEYAVTRWAAWGLENTWDGFALHPSLSPLPQPKPEHLRETPDA